MLFTSLHNQTTQSIAHCERLIEQLKQQLAAAQEQLNHLHQQQQGELTASSTAQTALEMVFKARRMIKVAYPNSPEAMAEFNRALMLDEGESNNSETPQPRLTETDEVIAVDVTVVPTPPGEPTDKSQPKYNGNGYNSKGDGYNSNGHEPNSNENNQQLNSKEDGYNSNGHEPNSNENNQQPNSNGDNQQLNSKEDGYNSKGDGYNSNGHEPNSNENNQQLNSKEDGYNSNGHEPNSNENNQQPNSNGDNQQLNSKGNGHNSNSHKPNNNGHEPNSNGNNQQLILSLNPSQEISTHNKYLTISQLKVLPRAQLQALATMKKVATNGNRLHIANRLNNQVTAEDLAKFTTSSTSVD